MTSLPILWRPLTRSRETGWRFAVAGALAYVAYLVVGHIHHEMWRDEIHAWTLARQAEGFWDLVTGDRVYEGHPPAWYWYLRLWTFLTRRPWGIHAATIAAMGTAALLFLRYAPFPRALKILLLSSYLLGFEYGVMSRNYTTTWLLLVVFCSLLHPLRPRFILLAIVLGLLALTTVFGAFMACGLAVMLVPLGVHLERSSSGARVLRCQMSTRFLCGSAAFLFALGFFVWSTSPPDPNYAVPDWHMDALNGDGLAYAFRRLVHAFLPLRPFGDRNYWTHWEYFWSAHQDLSLGVGIVLFTMVVVTLLPGRFELAGVLIGYVMMSVFTIVRYGGDIRHIGNLFLLFLGGTWIHRLKAPRRNHALSTALLLVCCGFQVESFLAAASGDWRYVFSGGRDMAAWIENKGLQDLPLVAGPDQLVLTVTSYLDRPFLSCQTEEMNVTQVFHNRREPFSGERLVQRASKEARARHRPVLVLSDEALPEPSNDLRLVLLHESPGSLRESFVLYQLEERDSGTAGVGTGSR